jgi:hypothetical protein
MMPSIRVVQEQLKTYQEILLDVMPQHIIDLMVLHSPTRRPASSGKHNAASGTTLSMEGAVVDDQDFLLDVDGESPMKQSACLLFHGQGLLISSLV